MYKNENTYLSSSTRADESIPKIPSTPYSRCVDFNVLLLASRLSISIGSRPGVTIALPIAIEIEIWGASTSPVS